MGWPERMAGVGKEGVAQVSQRSNIIPSKVTTIIGFRLLIQVLSSSPLYLSPVHFYLLYIFACNSLLDLLFSNFWLNPLLHKMPLYFKLEKGDLPLRNALQSFCHASRSGAPTSRLSFTFSAWESYKCMNIGFIYPAKLHGLKTIFVSSQIEIT